MLPLIAAGCGGPPRAALEGEVTYAGEPIPVGALRLFPLTKTAGFGAETAIEDGKYTLKINDGLFSGEYRVEIRATRTTGPVELPDEGIPGMDQPKEIHDEYVPKRYNDRTTLQVKLEPGTNHHNFALLRDEKWERQKQKEMPDWLQAVNKKGK